MGLVRQGLESLPPIASSVLPRTTPIVERVTAAKKLTEYGNKLKRPSLTQVRLIA